MSLERLKQSDKDVVYQCLLAALNGPFFPDWEFHTLFGVEREVLAEIIEIWPRIDRSEDTNLAITNSMGNLIGYPHGKEKEWGKYVSASPDEVLATLKRWREFQGE